MAYPYLAPGARLTAVKLKDSAGNPLGEVKEWMMDADEGRVVYVLATFEENATEYVAIPWPLLKADRENGGYRVGKSKEELLNGPRVSTDAKATNDLITNTALLDEVYQHYDARAYWQGGVTDATPSAISSAANETAGEGQSQPNDLKEERDAAATGDPLGGRTNVEHGEGMGYGGSQPPVDPATS